MDITDQVKEILNNLFTVTAKKNRSAKKEVALIFQLKSLEKYKCSYNRQEVNVSDAGAKAFLLASGINSKITSSLVRLAKKNSIDVSLINVQVQPNDDNDFVLVLRNGNTAVKQIELSEFIN